MYRDHQALLDYLSAGVGEKFDLQLFAGYGDMVRAIREGEIELAWLGPLAYLDAEDALARHPKYKLEPIVKPKRHGNTYYASEIIVRKDSGIDSVGQLAGKRMAFVDTQSTAGYLLAAAHLVQSGIPVNDPILRDRHFVNQYGNVVLSVLFDRYDAGAVFEGATAVFLKGREKDRKAELKVLTQSDSVPYEPIAAVVGGRLTDAQAARIQQLFLALSMDTTYADILKKIQVEGFVVSQAREYEPIRRIVRIVNQIRDEEPDPHAIQP